MRMRPSCSSTNRRPLPSPACVSCTGCCVICTGCNRPYDAIDTGSGGMTLYRMRTSRYATHPSCRVVRMRTLSIFCGGSILKAKTSPSAARSVSKRCQPTIFPALSIRILCVAGRETPALQSTRSFPLATNGVNVFQAIVGQSRGQTTRYQCRRQLPSIVLVSSPVRNLTSPSCATFTNNRLSCVVGIACAILWVWMGAQEVINSAANAMMNFILPLLRIPEF